jgi:CRISPR system Cascade subunit CasA
VGVFSRDAIEAEVDRVFDLFDLFDSERPFMQDASLPTNAPTTIAVLDHGLASGNNKLLRDRTLDAEPPAFSPVRAVRAMLSYFACSPCGAMTFIERGDGGVSLRGGAGGPGSPFYSAAAVILRGKNLFSTLCLNMIPYDDRSRYQLETDLPAWERGTNELGSVRIPSGILDIFSWPTRAIRLLPEEGLVVRRIVLANGDRIDPEAGIQDPMVSYQHIDKVGVVPVGIREDEQTWRNISALLAPQQRVEGRWTGRPRTLRVAYENYQEDLPILNVDVIGAIFKNSASFILWRRDAFPLSPSLLGSDLAFSRLQLASDILSHTESALYRAMSRFRGTQDLVKTVRSVCQSRFWEEARMPFLRLVAAGPTEGEIERFIRRVRVVAYHCLRETIADRAGLMEVARLESALTRNLANKSSSRRKQ